MRGGSVLIVDAADQVTQTVGRQQQMQLAGDAQRVPRAGGLLGSEAAQPDGAEGRGGFAVDGVECAGLRVAAVCVQ